MSASLVQGFTTLDALSGFVVVWLHPTPIRPCLDVTIWDALPRCQLPCAHFSPFPLYAMICLPCLFVPPVGSICIFYTLAYMSMHESCLLVCRPCFNTMKLWTSNPNLYLSLADTTFFFAFLLVCLHPCFYACHAYHVYLLYAFSYALHIFSFHGLSVGFLSLPLHVHIWSEDAWS